METVFENSVACIKRKKNNIVVSIVSTPTAAQASELMGEYERFLLSEPETKHLAILMDAFEVSFFADPFAVTKITNKFLKMRRVSESRIKCFALKMGSSALASIVNGVLKANPGPIPTGVFSDTEECKAFLRIYNLPSSAASAATPSVRL